jgi:hypothetical protein
MEMLAQFGYFGQASPWACSLYGLVMMVMSVWLALNLEKPRQED